MGGEVINDTPRFVLIVSRRLLPRIAYQTAQRVGHKTRFGRSLVSEQTAEPTVLVKSSPILRWLRRSMCLNRARQQVM